VSLEIKLDLKQRGDGPSERTRVAQLIFPQVALKCWDAVIGKSHRRQLSAAAGATADF